MTRFYNHFLNRTRLRIDNEALEIVKNIPNAGSIIDDAGNILLHFTAVIGYYKATEYLLKSGTNIDAQNSNGETPLMFAATRDMNFAVIDLLLKFNANIHICNKSGKCVLQLADKMAQPQILRKLCDDNLNDNEKIAKILIPLNYPVYHAITIGNAQLTQILMKHGSPIECPQYLIPTETALAQAVTGGNLEIVKMLLDYGLDVNAEDHRGNTALTRYGLCGPNQNPEVLRLLLNRGVDPSKILISDKKFIQIGHMHMYTILMYSKRKSIQVVFEHNLDLFAKDGIGNTVAHYMAENHDPDVFKELHGKKYDANAKNNHGSTPLHYVCITNVSSVNFLIDAGADVDVKNDKGNTPLMKIWKKKRGYNRYEEAFIFRAKIKQVIDCLLHHGADSQVYCGRTQEHLIFSNIDGEYEFDWIQSVLAHLAITKARGMFIEIIIRKKIKERALLEEYFQMCTQQINGMKQVKVLKYLTLHDFLIASKGKIERLLCNKKLLSNLRRIRYKNKYLPYYQYVIRDRIVKAMKIVELRKKASPIICEIFGWQHHSNVVILDVIVKYLNISDLQKICCYN